MKKFKSLMFFLLAGGVVLFSGCGGDDDDTSDKSPTINFVGGTGYTDSDITVSVNAKYQVGINATANATSDSKLKRFEVRTSKNAANALLDSTISAKTFGSWTGLFDASSTAGVETLSFKVTDADGESATISVTITTIAVGPISSYTSLVLGGKDNATLGSFLDATGGVVHLTTAAQANPADIDAVFFEGSGMATIASPTDSEAKGLFTTLPLGANDNATTFVDLSTTMTVSDFNAITDDAQFGGFTPSATQVSALAMNSVVGFTTAGGKAGLILVTGLTAGTAGTLTVSVKVQQ